MYRERASRFDGATVWTRVGTGGQRVLPDGCMDLIWDGTHVFVAGPDTHAHLASEAWSTTFTGLRFAPGTGPSVIGAPAHALRDQRVPLDAVWRPDAARRLAEQLAGDPAPGRVLEVAAAHRARATRVGDVRSPEIIGAVVRDLRAGRTVSTIAEAVGLSERQLHRRSLDAFGYGPKFLARVLRMNRALELSRAGVPFAETAARSGFADQAHLARDVRALTGVPLGELAA